MLTTHDTQHKNFQSNLILNNAEWEQQVNRTYFNLNVSFKSPHSSSGRLKDGVLGSIGISCLQSTPAQYRRNHTSADESYFLITLPLYHNIHMQQAHKDVICDAGHILLQHANDPYLFEYTQDNSMWVAKVPASLLQKYIPCPEIYTAMSFNGLSGVGRLFSQNVLLLGEELLSGRLDLNQEQFYTHYLLSLFTQVLQQDERIVYSDHSSIRQAQLYKVQNHITNHLQDADLSPQSVAQACGISVRYVHNLFKDQDSTFTRFLQQQRLKYAFEILANKTPLSITEVAYQSGFNDQSHFTRLFKQTYQYTPKDIKLQKHIAQS